MRWTSGSDSSNVEDRRGSRGGVVGIGGTVIALVLSLIFGRDIFSGGSPQSTPSANGEVAPVEQSPAEAREAAAREFGLQDVASCMQWLLSTPLDRSRIEILACHLTVGETYFFRDPKAFDALRGLLRDDDAQTRASAVYYFALRGGPEL